MKKLLIALLALLMPAVVLAQSFTPTLYLEIFDLGQGEDEPDPVPDYVCRHPYQPWWEPLYMSCYVPRYRYEWVGIPIHLTKLGPPECPYPVGPACEGYGGYSGVPFGVVQTGVHPIMFIGWNACPGFVKGPSEAGEPAACVALSDLCHSSWEHAGYLLYLNISTSIEANYFHIVANADLGHNMVMSCSGTYYVNTAVGGSSVQCGGTQSFACPGPPTDVDQTTWGRIKTMFR